MFQHYIMQTDLILLYSFGVKCKPFYLYQWIYGAPVESTCGILSLTDISMCLYMLYMLCTR